MTLTSDQRISKDKMAAALKTAKTLGKNEKYRSILFGGMGIHDQIESQCPEDVKFTSTATVVVKDADGYSSTCYLPPFTIWATDKEDFIKIISKEAAAMWDYYDETFDRKSKFDFRKFLEKMKQKLFHIYKLYKGELK